MQKDTFYMFDQNRHNTIHEAMYHMVLRYAMLCIIHSHLVIRVIGMPRNNIKCHSR